MAYTVNKFDGTLIATVEDGTIDNTTNPRSIGKTMQDTVKFKTKTSCICWKTLQAVLFLRSSCWSNVV